MIKLAISGYQGKMGQRITALAAEDKEFNITAKIEMNDSIEAVKAADVLIEFTSPEATIEHLRACAKLSKSIVIGTTGLSEAQLSEIKLTAKAVPVVYSPNMSVGVNCLFGLVRSAAKKLGLDYEVNIVEAHHAHKKDSPSGTAKRLAQIIKESSGREVKNINAIREGEIIGDHRVIFESSVDKIELFHTAKTRDIFVLGALRAAKFIVGKKPGLYSMEDVLGIK
ncbi:MAG: 4-hydroxy-tetrahydrodipicolinate reductase [Candidatus Omnitrophica bacterium CG12_big_fil_rev_8_21_14_0_65_43_15]|uniref:4-hydroxy-tetrahydrodipicolinate reductase n=1 Tax=Candidatus Taenaricola geysiri TaxID=1974752 RepID=A0A2J0LKP6_9BACT|nr:MAG: 4-hydroxy-tetrahydrodipicolinate reductase [Candidatus Omnitrophica bacterium CG1_02_43_210]PIR65423.1 MAG: 4-hydroxy-tetrahydrodipicolinate reductase [Candidatus Omnitrophica bacterium CG10_big_fil_rev_8_21_14_0_10_43_8]PIV12524.1 MAG: 4-hydroxy-tetrahydrodipicolinate reductase [Candidatus Omnitrophica bacterium CG03_land_8_20_14_0_80_43_22]PIW66183.1 MAG: 4-hydroxy-tetrahydrodipicolinate reductase [Candidatus Omnitrophica bacterium CG12_big_fil_rev_8_21_14_0_65_43_15]PIW80241.1 MAG: 4